MKEQSRNFDVIVIGGGASGMMAAAIAAEKGARVAVLEKNPKLGEKLKITGGGRCNITNAEYDTRTLLHQYGESESFLYSAFSQFGVTESIDFFESNGLPIVVEEHKRAFPKSQRATDVFLTLEKILLKKKVSIFPNTKVTNIQSQDGQISSVVTNSGTYIAKNYILATGGKSHPETGSTGDGFLWLETLGHTIVPPTPSIVPLVVKESWVKKLKGTSLDNMRITFFVNDEKRFKKLGRILFTHFGISGPLILNCSKQVGDLLHEGSVTASIDVFPNFDPGALEKKILTVFDVNKNKMLKNVFHHIIPGSLGDTILSLIKEINPDTKIHSITVTERKKILQLLKSLPLTIAGLKGFDHAVIADGGVPLTEVNTKTMQSKLLSNLFVTGDLLHINRPSGGYSLQLCWTTGYVAGLYGALQ